MENQRLEPPYIALEELNYFWRHEDVLHIDRMWSQGLSLEHIAQVFSRDPDEVVLIIMDRKRMGMIKDRPGGIWGGKAAGTTR